MWSRPPLRRMILFSTLKRRAESVAAYTFIAPFYVLFVIFNVFPVFFSLFISFQKWSGFDRMRWVGLKNYADLYRDPSLWSSLTNTVLIWLGNVFIIVGLGLSMALLLNSRRLALKGLFRGFFYLPQAIAVVAISLAFGYIFDKEFGVLNSVLRAVGMPDVPWLVQKDWARVSVIAVILWRSAPWHMLIMLAGLQSIEESLYEAARMDGASVWQTTTRVTVPLLKPMFFYCFLMATIYSFRLFAEPFVITEGGPGDATTTIAVYMYRSGFEFLKLGYAAAMSFLLLVLILLVSAFQLSFFRSEV